MKSWRPVGFGEANTWELGDDVVSLVRPPIQPRPLRFKTITGPDIIVDMARAALLVVDMQNHFLHPDGWFAQKGVALSQLHSIIPNINILCEYFRGNGTPVFW